MKLSEFLESLINQEIYIRINAYPKTVQRHGILKDFDDYTILYHDHDEGFVVVPWAICSIRRKK